ncbi:MAG TPA: hypothetical protein PKY25_01750 [Bacilli bacterium]|nr:hypothetical protein [Bacilli bacterium]
MKKIMLLLLLVVILSGCSIKDISKTDYKSIKAMVLSKKIKNFNTISKGYKYYAPRGIVIENSDEYNDTLRRNKMKYYLFVDIVSYYKKIKFEYKVQDKIYHSEKIGNNGYLYITKIKGKYFIEMMYNYSKVESYVEEENLDLAINDISVILASIKFNDLLLKKMYEEGGLNSKEEVFNILSPKEEENNILESIEEYDKYEKTTKPIDNDVIITTTTTQSVQ